MNRDEAAMAICYLKEDYKELLTEEDTEALVMAIRALKREQPDEWCTDCKEYDTEKKCCPRFNRVIRGAMNDIAKWRTWSHTYDNACMNGTQGDLISRAEAIYEIHDFFSELMDELPRTVDEDGDWIITDTKTANTLLVYNKMLCKRVDELPSADRPRGEWIEETSWKYKKGGRNSDMKEVLGTEWLTMIRQRCSECNMVTMVDDSILYKYCPHCGAVMRSE